MILFNLSRTNSFLVDFDDDDGRGRLVDRQCPTLRISSSRDRIGCWRAFSGRGRSRDGRRGHSGFRHSGGRLSASTDTGPAAQISCDSTTAITAKVSSPSTGKIFWLVQNNPKNPKFLFLKLVVPPTCPGIPSACPTTSSGQHPVLGTTCCPTKRSILGTACCPAERSVMGSASATSSAAGRPAERLSAAADHSGA